MTTGKTIALTRLTFVGKVMSLLFNMLSSLVNKGHIWEPHSQHQQWKVENISSKIKQLDKKGNKKHPSHKRKIIFSICRWCILYIKNPQDSTKTELELISEFSKVTWYNINRQKSFVFLYRQCNTWEKKVLFPKASETIKYYRINVTKEVKDLYTENYETLMKEIENTNKLKNNPYAWIRKNNTFKMPILPKAIFRLNEIPIKILMAYFSEIENTILKSMGNHRRPQIAKAVLRKKNKSRGIVHFQSCIDSYSMVLIWKQTHGPMEQNIERK